MINDGSLKKTSYGFSFNQVLVLGTYERTPQTAKLSSIESR